MNNPATTQARYSTGRAPLSPEDIINSATAKFAKSNAILELINENTDDSDMNAINGSAWAVRDFIAEAETELLALIDELTSPGHFQGESTSPDSSALDSSSPASLEAKETIRRVVDALEASPLDSSSSIVRDLQKLLERMETPA